MQTLTGQHRETVHNSVILLSQYVDRLMQIDINEVGYHSGCLSDGVRMSIKWTKTCRSLSSVIVIL